MQLTNTPSDNFFAETLLKDIGARFGGAGTTAAGAAVVRAQIAASFGIHPRLERRLRPVALRPDHPDSRWSRCSAQMAGNSAFVSSLARRGRERDAAVDEMRGTYAAGRCRGKTGTLHDVANLAGYCTGADGHTLAFAFLMNGLGDPDYVHSIEANMTVALAKYNG